MISIIQVCKNKKDIFQSNLEKYDGVVEVLRPSGNNPAKLRNDASLKAKGDILLFLDDDSYIDEFTIQRYVTILADEQIDIIGGPALIRFKNLFTEVVSHLMSSKYVIGPHSNRYRKCGDFRESGEKELILCNLAIRKSVFLEFQGFSDHLFPWEENEFLNKLKKSGVRSFYDPSLSTTREMTNSVSKLFYKIYTYGKGRGKMGGIDTLLYLLPISIYLLSIYFALTFEALFFAKLYLVYIFFIILMIMKKTRSLKSIILTPVVTWGIHFFYGQGLLVGITLLFIRKCFGHFLNSSNRINVLKKPLFHSE